MGNKVLFGEIQRKFLFKIVGNNTNYYNKFYSKQLVCLYDAFD